MMFVLMSKIGSFFFDVQELFYTGYSTDYIVETILSERDVSENFVIKTIDSIKESYNVT